MAAVTRSSLEFTPHIPSVVDLVATLNTAMSPYHRLEQDAGDVANPLTYKFEHHSPDGKFRMLFFTNVNNVDQEAPRV